MRLNESKCENNVVGIAEPIEDKPCIAEKVYNLEGMASELKRKIESIEEKILGPKATINGYCDSKEGVLKNRTINNSLDDIKRNLNMIGNILENINDRL